MMAGCLRTHVTKTGEEGKHSGGEATVEDDDIMHEL
jgi:hypothetical protein